MKENTLEITKTSLLVFLCQTDLTLKCSIFKKVNGLIDHLFLQLAWICPRPVMLKMLQMTETGNFRFVLWGIHFKSVCIHNTFACADLFPAKTKTQTQVYKHINHIVDANEQTCLILHYGGRLCTCSHPCTYDGAILPRGQVDVNKVILRVIMSNITFNNE